jgi:hypothetical protein
VKLGILALVLATAAPAHVRLGPVSLPVAVFLIAAEVLAAVASTCLAIRLIRRFRSSPWLRPALITGGAW